MRIYPYNCEAGIIYLYNASLYNNKTVDACNSVYVCNYLVKYNVNLTINVGNSFLILNNYATESQSTLTINPVDIKTGFIE